MTRLLIVDDEEVFREDLGALLRAGGYECQTAANGEDGLSIADRFRPDIALCDLVMPGMGGLEVVGRLAAEHPACSVLLVTANATVATAIEAFRRGALDLVLKPLVVESLLNTLKHIDERRQLLANVAALRRELAQVGPTNALIGSSRQMGEVRQLARRVAAHDAPVLVTGASGTGKEVVARFIHSQGPRSRGPFVAVNCLAVSSTLFENELFGHAKGAFTGANAHHRGFFEAATSGTLLLDEVGEIPLALQGKLLRAVEQREVTRIGETKPVPVDARIVAATNRDLAAMVEAGTFRTDLYYRLRVVTLELPTLRERADDIPELVEQFLRDLNTRMGLQCYQVAPDARAALCGYGWPGNVRELRNTIERALIVGDGHVLALRDLPAEIRAGSPNGVGSEDNLKTAMRAAEVSHIRRVMRRCGGNRADAARRLGIDPSTLWRKLDALD